MVVSDMNCGDFLPGMTLLTEVAFRATGMLPPHQQPSANGLYGGGAYNPFEASAGTSLADQYRAQQEAEHETGPMRCAGMLATVAMFNAISLWH